MLFSGHVLSRRRISEVLVVWLLLKQLDGPYLGWHAHSSFESAGVYKLFDQSIEGSQPYNMAYNMQLVPIKV